jgi:hypothetical protein
MTYEAPQVVAAGLSDSLILTGTKLNTCKEVGTTQHSASAYEVDE